MGTSPRRTAAPNSGATSWRLVAIVAPHAGLMYSGPVAAHAYRLLRDRRFDVAILVGPSHFVAFEGVAVVPGGAFETPFGLVAIDEDCASDLRRTATPLSTTTHRRPWSRALARDAAAVSPARRADAKIVPLLMGYQTAETAVALSAALGAAVAGRRALLVASTDLSHYHDAATASRLDAVVSRLRPAIRSRRAAGCAGCAAGTRVRRRTHRRRDARREARRRQDAVVLAYADSGDVSGDKAAVVGYMAAAFGNFRQRPTTESTKATRKGTIGLS